MTAPIVSTSATNELPPAVKTELALMLSDVTDYDFPDLPLQDIEIVLNRFGYTLGLEEYDYDDEGSDDFLIYSFSTDEAVTDHIIEVDWASNDDGSLIVHASVEPLSAEEMADLIDNLENEEAWGDDQADPVPDVGDMEDAGVFTTDPSVGMWESLLAETKWYAVYKEQPGSFTSKLKVSPFTKDRAAADKEADRLGKRDPKSRYYVDSIERNDWDESRNILAEMTKLNPSRFKSKAEIEAEVKKANDFIDSLKHGSTEAAAMDFIGDLQNYIKALLALKESKKDCTGEEECDCGCKEVDEARDADGDKAKALKVLNDFLDKHPNADIEDASVRMENGHWTADAIRLPNGEKWFLSVYPGTKNKYYMEKQ